MKRKEKLFMSISLILCLLLFCKRLTGEICHVILGMVLWGMTAVHVCRHIGKLKYKKGSVRITDLVMLIALAFVFLSGMLLHPLQGTSVVLILHKMSSVIFVIGMIVHVVQHRLSISWHLNKKNTLRTIKDSGITYIAYRWICDTETYT